MTRTINALLLGLCALSAVACQQNPFAQPPSIQARLIDQPYYWDQVAMDNTAWNAWLSSLPALERPLNVVVTTPEVWVCAKYIGRDTTLASLYSIMPFAEEGKGLVYHTYDATQAKADKPEEFPSRKEETLAKLKSADIIFRAGPGVDDWLSSLVTESGTTAKVFDLSQRMTPLMGQYPITDAAGLNGVSYETKPLNYWWTNLETSSIAVDSLEFTFNHLYPSQTATIHGYTEDWLGQLGGLNGELSRFMLDQPELNANSVMPRRVLIDSPALIPFCKRFDLTIIDIINTDWTTPPSAERIAEITKKAKDQRVSHIITTAAYHTAAVETIANGLTVEIVNAEGAHEQVAVPVTTLAMGLYEGGAGTEDFVPFHLFNAQKLATVYKPILEGLMRLKDEYQQAQKDAAKAETAPPAEGETPPAEGATPPVEGTTPPAEGTTPPTEGTTPPAETPAEPAPAE